MVAKNGWRSVNDNTGDHIVNLRDGPIWCVCVNVIKTNCIYIWIGLLFFFNTIVVHDTLSKYLLHIWRLSVYQCNFELGNFATLIDEVGFRIGRISLHESIIAN